MASEEKPPSFGGHHEPSSDNPASAAAPTPHLNRTEQQAADEAALKELLHTNNLPPQKVSAAEWEAYEARLHSGDIETAVHEITLRQLRKIYSRARKINEIFGSAELTTEDLFQSGYVGVVEKLERHARYGQRRHHTLMRVVDRAIFRSIETAIHSRGLITDSEAQIKIDALFFPNRHIHKSPATSYASEEDEQKVTFADYSEILDIQNQANDIRYSEGEAELLAQAAAGERKDNLSHLLECALNDRQRYVIDLRFGLVDGKEHVFNEIGKRLKVTRARAQQLGEHALELLANHPEADALRDVDDARYMLAGLRQAQEEYRKRSDLSPAEQKKASRQWVAAEALVGFLKRWDPQDLAYERERKSRQVRAARILAKGDKDRPSQ